MSLLAEKNNLSVIKIVQELLLEEDVSKITPALIDEKISLVLLMYKKWEDQIDRNTIIEELIRRYSVVWVEHDTTLTSSEGHIPWLAHERKTDWRYWQRYREWQEAKLPWSAVKKLDEKTDDILGLLEDPRREGPWDRRGLVVGHVQSGKTGNYTGLICKAADAGYKIIIVLAGMHNNLRSQTQMRLDEGFLGYETDPDPSKLQAIGVGAHGRDYDIRPNYATNRTEKGDFNSKIANSLGIRPEQRPWLFVVKKNKSVLEKLHKWILSHVANHIDSETGRKIVTHLPLLVIDDEADNASVDTGADIVGVDGLPDEDHQPKAINKLIRQILHSFQRKAYVGYTATPFANIYIHERGVTKEEGADLFPSAFIINLAAPSNYIGPAKVFGLNSGSQREPGLPLNRVISDYSSECGRTGWMPTQHKNGHIPDSVSEHGMPASLIEAVNSFIIACAVRKLRGQGREHSSMLIHVTRFNSVQKIVSAQVEKYVRFLEQRLVRKIGHESILISLKNLWENDFLSTKLKMLKISPDLVVDTNHSWVDIEELLSSVVEEINVRMINGTAKDALDYADSASGLKVIAIGGDKLSRGLTLEGLCVSYFLRASKMYDTLMQMGRWFGYRVGYLDLCRLYTTSDLIEWFEHIADAAEELREEFAIMESNGATPRDYGLKVISHPVLMVTSPLKMRSSKKLYLSFSGSAVETVSFYKDESCKAGNYKAFNNMLAAVPPPKTIPVRARGVNGSDRWQGAFWAGVSYRIITEFLTNYKTHKDSLKVNSKMLCSFIEDMAKAGELTNWNIAFIGGGEQENPFIFDNDIEVKRAKRTDKSNDVNKYSIATLLQSIDKSLDMDEEDWSAALILTRKNSEAERPNAPALMHVRGLNEDGSPKQNTRGLLLIYLLDPKASKVSDSSDEIPFVGFGLCFPKSANTSVKVEYEVNNTLWEVEYGSAE